MSKRLIIFICLFFVMAIAMAQQEENVPRPKVGLVLGGGGAKGAAEIGVLKVIESADIPIDYIAGTSIGSIVGGLYANGYTASQLEELFTSQQWISLIADQQSHLSRTPYHVEDGVTYIFGIPVSRKKSKHKDTNFGALKGDNILAVLDSLTGYQGDKVNFDTLKIPFRCVAADIMGEKEVVLSKGSLPRSMRASMAIPGAFKPVVINKVKLIDGGTYNNLPVDVVKDMGAEIVIAIDLSQDQDEGGLDDKLPIKLSDLADKDKPGLVDHIIKWIGERPDIVKYNETVKMADLVINPKLGGYGVTSFSHKAMVDMIDMGIKAAEAQWDDLIALKKRIYNE
ncbi:MAG: patatin-like phospholipase family protein [Prevotella sp.]|nr:patatin-like phospholipase family protein [Prevotella sp.]